MNLPKHIEESFQAATKALVFMSEDIAFLEKKYGTDSSIVKKRKQEYACFFSFFHEMRDVVFKTFVGLRMATINQEALYIMENKRQMGVSWNTAKELLGIPDEKIKDLETLDQILERIMLPTGL